ncbi:hypothetical protein Y032_0151g2837 [Ancylostoma ceylanicum]|uniref:Uncharacterized protein n=1 Tax=Ancylostoma ceylanicum TaxID=53326 RepID=A0A016T164_9BILA|nr:hypothetical protein Y032_0151g2837 [Ancylostoma ceylanicum]
MLGNSNNNTSSCLIVGCKDFENELNEEAKEQCADDAQQWVHERPHWSKLRTTIGDQSRWSRRFPAQDRGSGCPLRTMASFSST